MDESLFVNSASNRCHGVFIRQNFDNMLFDPFNVYNSTDVNDNDVWDDSDPDVNYYLQKQHIHMKCNAKYYNID